MFRHTYSPKPLKHNTKKTNPHLSQRSKPRWIPLLGTLGNVSVNLFLGSTQVELHIITNTHTVERRLQKKKKKDGQRTPNVDGNQPTSPKNIGNRRQRKRFETTPTGDLVLPPPDAHRKRKSPYWSDVKRRNR